MTASLSRKRKSCSTNDGTFTTDNDILVGKDGTQWTVILQDHMHRGRINSHNVFSAKPGPTSFAKRQVETDNALSSLFLFIDKFIIEHIVECTNTEARLKRNDDSFVVSKDDILKFIGISYVRGIVLKGVPTKTIWSLKWGSPMLRKLMSRDKYYNMLKYIRFDKKSSRSERLKNDKFALFSTVWDRFIENCSSNYIPSDCITVDEQLFPTKARCRFTQYMASKPDKFGIKFWLAVDVKTKYLLNGFPYLGKDVQRPKDEPVSENVVMKLLNPYQGKGRNVTCDNFFTSVNLAKRLAAKKTSIVGTVNKSGREVPQQIKTMKASLYSSTVLKNDTCTLTVYQGKVAKNVLLLSTMHNYITFSDGRKKLPETVAYYNATKFGVDILDQMARKYSTKVSCRRWPLQVFYNLLDFAAINSHIIYKEVTNEKLSRREFIQKLIEEICGTNQGTVHG